MSTNYLIINDMLIKRFYWAFDCFNLDEVKPDVFKLKAYIKPYEDWWPEDTHWLKTCIEKRNAKNVNCRFLDKPIVGRYVEVWFDFI